MSDCVRSCRGGDNGTIGVEVDMSFQGYLDAVKAKTGKTSADFAKLAGQKGLTTSGEMDSQARNCAP
jgi:hypothetical protein